MKNIKKFLANIYTIWAVFWCGLGFLICYPSFFICVQHPKLYPGAHFTNRVWGFWTFLGCGLYIKTEWRFKYDKKQTYVYCANHSSFSDIPTLFLTVPGYFNIIGKAELNSVPLFGYMFKRVYISVDRRTSTGRYKAYTDVVDSLKGGRSVVFYPEGTIPKHGLPKMIPFKDGAFKTAIELQIPVVPVSLPYNWKILPDKGKETRANLHICKVIFHEPVPTKGLTLDDLEQLKEQVYSIIDLEILKHNPNAY